MIDLLCPRTFWKYRRLRMLFFEFPSHPGEIFSTFRKKNEMEFNPEWFVVILVIHMEFKGMDIKCPQNGFEWDSNGIDFVFSFSKAKGAKSWNVLQKVVLQGQSHPSSIYSPDNLTYPLKNHLPSHLWSGYPSKETNIIISPNGTVDGDMWSLSSPWSPRQGPRRWRGRAAATGNADSTPWPGAHGTETLGAWTHLLGSNKIWEKWTSAVYHVFSGIFGGLNWIELDMIHLVFMFLSCYVFLKTQVGLDWRILGEENTATHHRAAKVVFRLPT